jgi:hypothetical protein
MPTEAQPLPAQELRPILGSGKQVNITNYDAKVSGTGYTVADVLVRFIIIDVSNTSAAPTSIWFNASTNTAISAPPSTDVEISSETAFAKLMDGSGNLLVSNVVNGIRRLAVYLGSGVAPGATAPGWMDVMGGVDGGGLARPFNLDTSGNFASLPLPAGAATGSLQTAGNTSLNNIDTDLGARTDAKATDSTSAWSVIALLKGLWDRLATLILGNLAPTTLTGTYQGTLANDIITGNTTTGNPANSWTDVTGFDYARILIQTDATGSGITVLLEGTNDTTNDSAGAAILAMDTTSTTFAASQTTASALGASAFARRIAPLGYRYIRLRISAVTAGNVRSTVQLCRGTLPVSMINAVGMPSVGIQPAPSATTNGVTTFHHLISAATTNATSVKATAGSLAYGEVSNNGAAAAYFKLYNKASAPTVGTDTPILTMMVAAGRREPIPTAIYERLSTGIAYAITGGMAVSDTTAVAITQVSVHLAYV